MLHLNQADQYLLAKIRTGDEDSWQQVVDRFQGRLLAFARRQLQSPHEAEDLVQDTFLGLLKNLETCEFWSSLETCLFTILRRRLIDHFRKTGRHQVVNMCSLQAHGSAEGELLHGELVDNDDCSPSQYAEQSELRSLAEERLWTALRATVELLQHDLQFQELQILELIFYAQWRNKDIARLLNCDEKQIALLKHRWIRRLAQLLSPNEQPESAKAQASLPDESSLSRIWEAHRPSCLKRTTLGKQSLGLLPKSWSDYINFHVSTLGCLACQANLLDMQNEVLQPSPHDSLRNRIMQSSIGFFRPT
ncbi:MAG: sigma-70 family RNA polymerase sigma factor [Planctomycetales bacterium]|nr:sigma-70 family RNA polymerase sigma factor [Planctomycetales bacterium]